MCNCVECAVADVLIWAVANSGRSQTATCIIARVELEYARELGDIASPSFGRAHQVAVARINDRFGGCANNKRPIFA